MASRRGTPEAFCRIPPAQCAPRRSAGQPERPGSASPDTGLRDSRPLKNGYLARKRVRPKGEAALPCAALAGSARPAGRLRWPAHPIAGLPGQQQLQVVDKIGVLPLSIVRPMRRRATAMSESMADHKPQNQTRLTRAVDQAETLIPDTGMAGGGHSFVAKLPHSCRSGTVQPETVTGYAEKSTPRLASRIDQARTRLISWCACQRIAHVVRWAIYRYHRSRDPPDKEGRDSDIR